MTSRRSKTVQTTTYWARVKSDTTAPADPKIGAVVPVELMLNDRSDPSSATKGRWAGGDQNAIYRGTADLTDGDIVLVQMTNLGLAIQPPGGGGSGCGSCCEAVDTGDMLHPHLPSGSDETTRTWSVAAGCGDAIAPISIPNAGGTGRTVWSGGLPEVDYDSSDHKFRYTIPQGNLTVFNNAGSDVTDDAGVTRSGSVVMDWSTTPPQISVTLDSTIS